MLKVAMSPAASGILRALIKRAGIDRNRILLMEIASTDWQSLTFIGERHEMRLKITGADADAAVARMIHGLPDAEFAIPGQVVADLVVFGEPERATDGSITVAIEALTIEE